VTGKEAIRRLCGEGWTIIRQTGKHTIVQKDGRTATISLGKMRNRAERSLLRLLRGQGTRSDQHSVAEGGMRQAREKRLPGPSCDLDDAGDPIPRDRMNAPPPPDLYPVRGPELDMDAAGDPLPRGRR